ncbi:hypothetical protein POKO110462_21960 [Pontibacter korlensis]|uniref:hypothetical protein n=1 Tax=Pontibacter korlensis TaxID=400092 RepID=UPI000695D7B9|nr:hypothetical protein [Pontibacter korlensis]
MKRKEFLSKSVRGVIRIAAALPVPNACKDEESISPADGTTTDSESCGLTDAETDGPYPL